MSILNAHRVKYLVIGAYAVAIHAQPRATKDLDILVKADTENAKAVFAALAEFGAPLQGLTPADFEEPGPRPSPKGRFATRTNCVGSAYRDKIEK